MSLFHVYNKFDSMDTVQVVANTEAEAIEIALADGYLNNKYAVCDSDVVAWAFKKDEWKNSFIPTLRAA